MTSKGEAENKILDVKKIYGEWGREREEETAEEDRDVRTAQCVAEVRNCWVL
jgi:hypothetical protein